MSVLAQNILQLGHLVPVILVNEALGLHREVLQQDRIADSTEAQNTVWHKRH